MVSIGGKGVVIGCAGFGVLEHLEKQIDTF
jgi:hypothetical protein